MIPAVSLAYYCCLFPTISKRLFILLVHIGMITNTSLCGSMFLERLETEKLWGIYQINWGSKNFDTGLRKQIQELGSTPDFVMFFRDLPNPRVFPAKSMEAIRKIGAVPVISLELQQWSHSPQSSHDWLRRINNGELDIDFKNWATDASAFADPILLRFGFEMNGDWFSWGSQPEEFKLAWKRIHRLFSDVGADNVYWVFFAEC